MTTYATDVDGEPAVVNERPSPQLGLLEVPTEDLCQLLYSKNRQIDDQERLINRQKAAMKILESEQAEIVSELAKRGEPQTNLLRPPPPRQRSEPPRAARAEAQPTTHEGETIVAQPGEMRLALTGPQYERGQYERIPQEDMPTVCVCGGEMASPAAVHDEHHAEYARSIGHELAPSAVAMPTHDADAIDDFAGIDRTLCTGPNCGLPIVFVKSEKGKDLPLDPNPIADGKYAIRARNENGVPILRKATDGDVRRYGSHFSTCVDAGKFGSGARTTARGSVSK